MHVVEVVTLEGEGCLLQRTHRTSSHSHPFFILPSLVEANACMSPAAISHIRMACVAVFLFISLYLGLDTLFCLSVPLPSSLHKSQENVTS